MFAPLIAGLAAGVAVIVGSVISACWWWRKEKGVNLPPQEEAAKLTTALPRASSNRPKPGLLRPVFRAFRQKVVYYAKRGAAAACALYAVVRGAIRRAIVFGGSVAAAAKAPGSLIPVYQRATHIGTHPEYAVVSTEVCGLIVPFRKSRVRNRDFLASAA